MKAELDIADWKADILAQEQPKNKLIVQCAENERKHNYHGPVTSQDDVNLMFAKTQKFSEQDRLSLLRKVIKVKKLIFLELPNDFVLYKQYNISSTKMYQNHLELHVIDSSNQKVKKSEEPFVDLEWPPSEEEFFIALLEN